MRKAMMSDLSKGYEVKWTATFEVIHATGEWAQVLPSGRRRPERRFPYKSEVLKTVTFTKEIGSDKTTYVFTHVSQRFEQVSTHLIMD